jgi:hypothetical protein
MDLGEIFAGNDQNDPNDQNPFFLLAKIRTPSFFMENPLFQS